MSGKKKPFFPPFRVGDVVRYKGNRTHTWKKGETCVVTGLNVYDVCDYHYDTTKGAWLYHNELELVRPCDRASILQILKGLDT